MSSYHLTCILTLQIFIFRWKKRKFKKKKYEKEARNRGSACEGDSEDMQVLLLGFCCVRRVNSATLLPPFGHLEKLSEGAKGEKTFNEQRKDA